MSEKQYTTLDNVLPILERVRIELGSQCMGLVMNKPTLDTFENRWKPQHSRDFKPTPPVVQYIMGLPVRLDTAIPENRIEVRGYFDEPVMIINLCSE